MENITHNHKLSNIPCFSVCESSGKYIANRKLTGDQIIKAAKKLMRESLAKGDVIEKPGDANDLLVAKFHGQKYESFVCIFLDIKGRILAVKELFRGTVDRAAVYPREILRQCMELNAAKVIISHNHPSGDVMPSDSDIEITKQIKFLLNVAGIELSDHIVVAGDRTLNIGFFIFPKD